MRRISSTLQICTIFSQRRLLFYHGILQQIRQTIGNSRTRQVMAIGQQRAALALLIYICPFVVIYNLTNLSHQANHADGINHCCKIGVSLFRYAKLPLISEVRGDLELWHVI